MDGTFLFSHNGYGNDNIQCGEMSEVITIVVTVTPPILHWDVEISLNGTTRRLAGLLLACYALFQGIDIGIDSKSLLIGRYTKSTETSHTQGYQKGYGIRLMT